MQYASEDAELLLVGNKLDCESDRIISRQQAERVRIRKLKILSFFHPHVVQNESQKFCVRTIEVTGVQC